MNIICNFNFIIAGDGWGAQAAFDSLYNSRMNLSVLTSDYSLINRCKHCEIPVINDLQALKNHVIVFAGYKPIVDKQVLVDNKCINIHYSLLPAYRGFHSTVWAILNDEERVGLTIHEMSEYIDDGDIINQYSIVNDQEKTSFDYMNEFNQYIQNNLFDVISKYLKGEIIPKRQDKSKASWVGKRNVNHCKVDFSKSLKFQKNFFRALVFPYPTPWILIGVTKYNIRKIKLHYSSIETDIGRLLNIDNEGLWIKCLDGYLIIQELEDEQGKLIDLNSFKIGLYCK